MATTITALGTVPQKIVDVATAGLANGTYQDMVVFDTHQAEWIGFLYTYTRSTETSLQCEIHGKIRETGEWVVLPITLSLATLSDSATTSRAFQLRLGRDIGQVRVRAQTTGVPGASVRLEVWAMLSAPTMPIIGQIY